MVERLLQIQEIRDQKDNSAPDGTTALMMATAKKHQKVMECFEVLKNGRDKLVIESAKFGQIYDGENKSEIRKQFQNEAFKNAVLSGDADVINHVKQIAPNGILPENIQDHVLDKKVLELVSQPNENPETSSKLVDFSKKFPLFNEKVEVSEDEKGINSIGKFSFSCPKFCCMEKMRAKLRSKQSNIYISDDIDLTDSCEK